MKALFDSNILIDFLNKYEEAKIELEKYNEKYISVITYIEVLVGAKTPSEKVATKAFLNNFKVVYIDEQIAQETVELKKTFKMKLGDALIMATGTTQNLLIVTRDKKDFFKNFNNIRIPYSI